VRQCAAVRTVVCSSVAVLVWQYGCGWQCVVCISASGSARQCVAVLAAVCGSALDSVRQCGSARVAVRQSAAVRQWVMPVRCASQYVQQCAAMCGSACGSV
jgi:hypothetical protein